MKNLHELLTAVKLCNEEMSHLLENMVEATRPKEDLVFPSLVSETPNDFRTESMHQLAKERGGKCLSKQYINNKTDLEWECSKGHRWKATPAKIRNKGTWCPACAGSKRLTIGDMQETANAHGGKCLSIKYYNVSTKLLWECAEGHRWEARPTDIRSGTWCPSCANIRKSKSMFGLDMGGYINEPNTRRN